MTKIRELLKEDRSIAKHMFKEFGVMLTQIDETIEELGISLNNVPQAYKSPIYDQISELRRLATRMNKTCKEIIDLLGRVKE